MSTHGEFAHELAIGSSTERFTLVRDDNKSPMYSIENFVPQYRNPLTFTQTDVPDEFYEDISQGWRDYYWKPMKEMLDKPER